MSYLTDLAKKIELNTPEHVLPTQERDTKNLFLLYALLAKIKGKDITNEDVHDVWCCWMELHGESHSSMIEYSKLSELVQFKDAPYVAAIKKALQ